MGFPPSLVSPLVEINKWLTDNLAVVVPKRREMSRGGNKDENVATRNYSITRLRKLFSSGRDRYAKKRAAPKLCFTGVFHVSAGVRAINMAPRSYRGYKTFRGLSREQGRYLPR